MGIHLTAIIERMFKVIDVNYKDVDLKNYIHDDRYTWSSKQQAKFEAWLADYLYLVPPARKELMKFPVKTVLACRRSAAEFIFQHGLRCSWDLTNDEYIELLDSEFKRLRKESNLTK